MLQRFDQPLQWTPAISNMLYLKQKSRYFQNLRNLVPRASFHAMIDLSWRVIPVYQKTKRGPGNEVANYDFTPCKNSCYLEYALSRIVRISNHIFSASLTDQLFNIFINDPIYTALETEVCNFADKTTFMHVRTL